jgi:hypothetical protein
MSDREKDLRDRWSLSLPAPEREAIEEELEAIETRRSKAKLQEIELRKAQRRRKAERR